MEIAYVQLGSSVAVTVLLLVAGTGIVQVGRVSKEQSSEVDSATKENVGKENFGWSGDGRLRREALSCMVW